MQDSRKTRVVIVGAGFGGLFCAKGLAGKDVEVTLIDRHNHHLFQPLLYQVATGFLGINDVALPVRSLFRGSDNIDIVMDTVRGVDREKQLVLTASRTYPFDYLVLATGAHYHFFGNDQWAPHVMLLKTLTDAIALRQRILTVFEQAELAQDEARRTQLLTFVVIGGGPTGAEMAGAIADVVNYALEREFRRIRPQHVRIILLEAAPRMLGTMPEPLSDYARQVLEHKGVDVRVSTPVKDIAKHRVTVADEVIASHTIIWAAGVKAVPMADWLGMESDRRGAIVVQPDLSVAGLPNVFVLGDAATVMHQGSPLPALASVAKQQGKYLAKHLLASKAGKASKPFHYWDLGAMATIGRNAAIADFGYLTLRGWLAWMFWGIVHIYFLTGFRNRVTVFLTWVWTYMTYSMSARILLKSESGEES